jgi:hypothetical protein
VPAGEEVYHGAGLVTGLGGCLSRRTQRIVDDMRLRFRPLLVFLKLLAALREGVRNLLIDSITLHERRLTLRKVSVNTHSRSQCAKPHESIS